MGKVGSSTMPHKRNPPVCEGIIALNRLVRATVPLAIEGMVADHERDKVVLQAEREFIGKVFNMTHADINKMVFVARSEEHTSELQSLMRNSYSVYCL